MTEGKKAIAPRFDKAEQDKIDHFRAERTQTEFVYDCVVAQLKIAEWREMDAHKKAVVLKHDCGAKFDVLRSGDAVFLMCKKCHVSRKVTQAEHEALLNAEQQSPQVPFLPNPQQPAANQS